MTVAPVRDELVTDEPGTEQPRTTVLCVAATLVGLGDLLMSVADARGRSGLPWVTTMYWLAILLLFLPPAAAAVWLRRDRGAHVFLVLLLTVGLYLVKIVTSPTNFATVDELQMLRSFNDLLHSHHLFVVNPIVGSYPRFPGSQIAIVAMTELTRLNLSNSAKIVIGVEHLVLCLALYQMVAIVLDDSLAGFLGVLVYACNPNFLYFDAEGSYESFALPLAVTVIFLLVLASRASEKARRTLLGLACVIGVTVCVSHHMTSYWLGVVLLGWTLLGLLRRRSVLISGPDLVPWLPALVVSGVAALWFVFVAQTQVRHELGPVVTSAFHAISQTVQGHLPAKAPFSTPSTSSDLNDPVVLQLIAFASVAVAMVLLVGGLLRLRYRRARQVPILLLLALGLLYPVTLALRLTQASTETSSRSSEFVFFGISVGLAVLALDRVKLNDGILFGRHRSTKDRRLGPRIIGGAMLVGLAVLAIGGIVVGQPPYDRTTGVYLANADVRSVTVTGERVATWAASHWPAGTAYASADITNGILIGGAGNFTPQTGDINGRPVSYLFDSPIFDDVSAGIVTGDKIRFLVVDNRLAQEPSATSNYPLQVSPDAPAHESSRLPVAYLDKFDHVPDVSRVYDDGTIRVYDTRLLLKAAARHTKGS